MRPWPSNAITVRAICSLLARPAPTTACFTRNGAYSKTGFSRSAAAEIAALWDFVQTGTVAQPLPVEA